MVAGFKELEGITADLGIEAWGKNLEEMFMQAGLGLAAIIAELPEDSDSITRNILIEAPSILDLLVKYLNEIIYLEEVDGFLLHHIPELSMENSCLKATLTGVTFNPSRHTINTHIKAATYHGLAIEETPGEVRVRVIFDI
jgi:SHS2 domain-containing protein